MSSEKNNIGCEAVRRPVAAEVAEFAQFLANRATALSERVNFKLESVMAADCPRPCDTERKEQQYPPLFSDMRNSFRGIEVALDSIENAISRTEL
mgnify:CR=1 FL=1